MPRKPAAPEPPAEKADPNRPRPPTVLDLAREAGVSKSTVSRVLNGSPNVSPEARARTLKTMERLGYHINLAARSLRTSRTSQVGLLVPAINNEVFGEIAERLEEVLAREGVSLAITSSGWSVEGELRALDVFESRGVDTMVVCVVNERDSRIVERLAKFGPPLVLLDRQIRGIKGDAVMTDHRIGLDESIEHLARLGHKRIGIRTATDLTRPGREQFAAYAAATARLGLATDGELVVRTDTYNHESGRQTAEALLAAGATAIIVCATVPVVAGALELLHDRDIRIPQSLSFVEYTDSELANMHVPRLSVILRPVADIGLAAGKLALARMANAQAPARVEIVSTQFLDRQSTGACLAHSS